MFTAEELEECDIFPKKLTTRNVIIFFIYAIIMSTACVLMYSFYSGRDFTSLISMESLKYGTDSYYLEKLWQLDNRFDYNISDRYSTDVLALIQNKHMFVKEYLSVSLPLIIKNVSTLNILNSFTIDKDKELIIEKRQDPNGFFSKEKYSTVTMAYNKFKEEAINKERILNYFINENYIEEIYEDLIKKLDALDFITKYLSIHSQGIKYTEGFDEMINPGHYENTENLLCQIEGEMDFMIISPLQRNSVYPLIKSYGPPNYSTTNFFKAEYGRFPNFRNAHRLYITLSKGDCLFIPAYWWFSTKTNENKHFAYVKFEFKSHSRWVDYIIKGLETGEF